MQVAKIISLESRRAEHAKRLRQRALAGFPWNELMEYTRVILNPVTARLPVNKRWMIEESVYRLAYESFLLGIQASRKIYREMRGGAEKSQWKERVERDFLAEGDRLISQTAHDFQLFQVLDEWLSQSVIVVMEDLMPRWLIRGVEYGLLLRKQRRI
ncbi:MAG: hypothetical protein CW342_07970 [Thermoactinomycetaceae bacterium]|nr:hypothetical protein [Thermoactinomycetaceae bacterium]